MRVLWLTAVVFLSVLAAPDGSAVAAVKNPKTRLLIVSSYSPAYIWSRATNRGAIAALLKYGYLDNQSQGKAFTQNDYVESSSAVIKKLWMNTKTKNRRAQIAQSTARVAAAVNEFNPELLVLGDDNATNYIGNQYLDTGLPMVFWGVDGSPLKYDLIDSLARPGNNITGVYQSGHLQQGVVLLKKLFPKIRTIAVLSDASPTGRAKAKKLARLARDGALPVRLVANIVTNSFETWKKRALESSQQADAFFMLNHNTLQESSGEAVDQLTAGAWYLRHIHKPEMANERQFGVEGMLAAVGDSGYRQAYAAITLASRILANGEDPARIAIEPTRRGPLTVNAQRARMLGIYALIRHDPRIDEWLPTALALRDKP